MKLNCDIVADLLPGYLDNTCSGESRRAVEAHLAECNDCRELLEELRSEVGEKEAEPVLNEAEVLKRTSWVIGKRAVGAAAGVTAIVIGWLIFFWMDYLYRWGDYRFVPFHELLTVVWLTVAPLAVFIWLAVVLWRCVRHRAWRKNAVLLCALLVLAAAQIGYSAANRNVTISVSWTSILEVGEDYIVIPGPDGQQVLEVSPIVCSLLVAGEQEYDIAYSYKTKDPTSFRLKYIRAVERPEGETRP